MTNHGNIRGTTRLIGLLGDPVAHSLSPAMHNAAIASLGLDLAYVPLPVKAADLGTVVDALKALNFVGANVTLPHKNAVIPLLDEISDISRTMGAVNTIVNRGGRLFGTTTDPDGFLNAFTEAGHDLDGKNVAVLGNGGSARTIAFTLALMTTARRVAIVARSPDKSAALVAEIKAVAPACDITGLSFAEYQEVRKDFQVIVNTTPVGMLPNVDASPLPAEALEPGQTVYDIVYNPEETVLIRNARQRGCPVVGGLGMLIHQGLASFGLWLQEAAPDAGTRFLSQGSSVFREGIRRQRELEGVTP
jgi:shikimate dehydrogenase